MTANCLIWSFFYFEKKLTFAQIWEIRCDGFPNLSQGSFLRHRKAFHTPYSEMLKLKFNHFLSCSNHPFFKDPFKDNSRFPPNLQLEWPEKLRRHAPTEGNQLKKKKKHKKWNMSPRCPQDILKMSPRCPLYVCKMFPRCLQDVPKMSVKES